MNLTLRTVSMILLGSLLAAHAASAAAGGKSDCSVRAVAGKWAFMTGIGRQMLGEPFPPGKDVTALGTMNIDRHGNLEGVFDLTVQDFAFIPRLTYAGSITVNDDCTGTVEFVTSNGAARTDSIVVLSGREMRGMSQDPNNLWTYEVRRLPVRHRGRDRDDD